MKTIDAAAAAIVLCFCSASHAQTLHESAITGSTSVSSYVPFAGYNFKAFPALMYGGNWFTAIEYADVPLEEQADTLIFQMWQLPGGGTPPLTSEITILGLNASFDDTTLTYTTLPTQKVVDAQVEYNGNGLYTFTVNKPTTVGGVGGNAYAYVIGAPTAPSGEEWHLAYNAQITTVAVPESGGPAILSVAGLLLLYRHRR